MIIDKAVAVVQDLLAEGYQNFEMSFRIGSYGPKIGVDTIVLRSGESFRWFVGLSLTLTEGPVRMLTGIYTTSSNGQEEFNPYWTTVANTAIQRFIKTEISDFWTAYFEHVIQVGHLIAEEHSVEYLANELELYHADIHQHELHSKVPERFRTWPMAVQTVAAEASGGDNNGQTVTVFGHSFAMFLREHGEQIVWSGDPLRSQVYNYFAKERQWS
ncbi:hypothetical protein [Weissella cibaria]|uniref:hypothetical protein n=1 Tax=Weissella cibaria TaxID=137591 RepID=UPI0013DCFCC9|nr:hypothetical protein [Weissella cibaria]NFA03631.1 hypothetical protein [Weissella cibaria]